LEGIEVRVTNLNHEVLKRCIESANQSSFDFDKSWQSKLDQDILDFQPDLIGVSCMFTMTHESLKKVITNETAAIMVETIQGEGGVREVSDTYIKDLRKICDERNLLLICLHLVSFLI